MSTQAESGAKTRGDKRPKARSVKVLYVDDDRANLLAFRAMVEDLYLVLTARNGEEALTKLAEERDIAVLITDQRMPGMSGAELCERAKVSHPDTVRMLVTAYSDLAAAIDAINRGHVSRYLRKPWNPEELLASLREAAELHQLTTTVQKLQVRIGETERLYALGVLIAGVGHELRNPLGWISTNLDYCRRALGGLGIRKTSGALSDADQETLSEIENALSDASEGAARILEIVEGISLSSRKEPAHLGPVDVNYVVRSIVRLVYGEATMRGRLEVVFDKEESIWVQGSPTRLGQVFLNLVVNALQALPPRRYEENQVRITTSTRNLESQEPQAVIEVVDNGSGMPPEQLDRIFDPFYTTKGQGTGLGLAISKQIVEEMGGRIEVQSELGKGTQFTVYLPLVCPT